jgi:signal transduction histidine kinase
VAQKLAPGVGLGLHVVRNLVLAMGGSVEARRNPDRGSTFEITLPGA